LVDPRLELGQICRVLDHVVRKRETRVACGLGAERNLGLATRRPVATHQALDLRGLRHVDDQYAVDVIAPAALDEQRYDEQLVGPARRTRLALHLRADRRVQDRLEALPRGWVAEY